MSRAARRVLLGSALALSASCSSATPLPAPFVFDTPGEVELVCFNRLTAAAAERLVSDDDVVLPFECCEPEGCRLEDINLPNVKAEDFHPVAHALVTQTADGEVAAVDLESSKVLDSERRIPGYTFVDVGGLPTAIVVPKFLPAAEPLESSEPVPPSGPIWTYVAGRELNSIRAIPTCRFLLGRPCGPELVETDDESVRIDFRLQTELLLPAAPQDMLLDPNGDALWVTLPSVGWIARVPLGTSADRLLLGKRAEEGSVAPFAFAARPQTRVAAQFAPTFFQVAQGLDLGSDPAAALVPIAEASSYEALCGLGYSYTPTPQLQLPNAPRAPSNGAPEPTRMRLMPANGSNPALLFVADRGQVALHAYAIEGGVLQSRGASYVGARLRDFAITPRVPSVAPDVRTLKSSEPAYPAPPANGPPPDEKQYLYAIDDLGGVMVFDLSFEGTTPRLQPLLAPLPRRDSLAMQNNYADRIWINGGESAARALEVVDTRDGDLAAGSAEYCGQVAVSDLKKAVTTAKEELRNKQAALKRAAERDKPAIRDEIKLAEKALAEAERRAALPENAGPKALRGVFVVVAASDGRVTVLDVHDLDLQCRVRESCTGNELVTPVDDSGAAVVAVRRHTVRLESHKEANVSLLGSDQLLANVSCPDGYRQTLEESSVCVPSDPWRQRDASWSVVYEGSIFDVPLATLTPSEADPDNQLTLRAPTGMNLCKRGVLAGQFQVAIASAPEDARTALKCPTVTRDTAQRLLVTEAFHDHLVLSLLPREGRNALTPSELLACYPRFVGAQLLLHEAYLVTNGTYLHRAKMDEQDPEGRCVEDGNLSPLFSSRAVVDERFQDPAIAFTLTNPEQEDPEDIHPTVTLGAQSRVLTRVNVDENSGRSDALPRRVRYFTETGDLFIVDQASQGLKRYTLTPFEPDNSRFR